MSALPRLVTAPLAGLSADAFVAILSDSPVFDGHPFRPLLAPLIKGYASGEITTERVLALPAGFRAKTLYVHSAETRKRTAHRERLAASVNDAVLHLTERGFRRIAILCDKGADRLPEILRGLMLGGYCFDRYREKKKKRKDSEVLLVVAKQELTRARRVVADECALLACVNECRDAVNEPANVATIDHMVERARRAAREARLNLRVLSAPALRKQGYNGLLAVGAGGSQPPRMVILEYRPKGITSKKHLCLVGKGVVFDSGGLSLKPAADMWTMKDDKAGAATVLYALKAAALRKVPVRITAILCLAENLPDSRATRPGDIFRAANGKHVHVDNTDAEGRLILSDDWFIDSLKFTEILAAIGTFVPVGVFPVMFGGVVSLTSM